MAVVAEEREHGRARARDDRVVGAGGKRGLERLVDRRAQRARGVLQVVLDAIEHGLGRQRGLHPRQRARQAERVAREPEAVGLGVDVAGAQLARRPAATTTE